MSDRPALRVVSGSPTAEELAVVTALVSAAAAAGDGGRDGDAPTRLRGSWSDPARAARGPLRPGPNAWRSSGW